MISVIIPCHNYGHLLAETLESLLRQSEPGWEALIIDSASTDNTPGIAKAYCEKDKRFRYYRNETGGVSRSRNIGIKSSGGEFLQFLDADDLLEPRKFQCDMEQFKKHPQADAVYSTPLFFRHPDAGSVYPNYKLTQEPQAPYILNVDSDRDAAVAKILEGNIFTINSPCMRKNSFANISFNESIGQNEDWLFWCTAVIGGLKFQYYDEADAKALIRVHPGSVSQNEFNMLLGGMIVTHLLQNMVQKPAHRKIIKRKLLGQRHRLLSLLMEKPEMYSADELKKKNLATALPPAIANKILQFITDGKTKELSKYLKFELLKLRVKLKLV